MDWLRQERKCSSGGSIVWRAMVKSFPFIGKWLACKGGRGTNVRIGKDPWIRCKGNYRLSEEPIRDAVPVDGRNVCSQGWKNADDLDLVGAKSDEWNFYARSLTSSALKLF
jgi:hypothetical protein